MAILTSWNYSSAGTFSQSVGQAEHIWLSSSTTGKTTLEVGQWSPATIIMDATNVAVVGVANNTRYISESQVCINEGVVRNLTTVEVTKENCTFRIDWSDTSIATQLSNCKFYAFNGVEPSIAPSNMTVVAFEHTGSSIRKNRVGGDTMGLAWNAANGIGGVSNSLSLASQASSATHSFYIGVSCSVLMYGLQTGSKLRISFDVS